MERMRPQPQPKGFPADTCPVYHPKSSISASFHHANRMLLPIAGEFRTPAIPAFSKQISRMPRPFARSLSYFMFKSNWLQIRWGFTEQTYRRSPAPDDHCKARRGFDPAFLNLKDFK
jgi:hypothetical protein